MNTELIPKHYNPIGHPPQLEMMVREKESLYVWSAL